MNYRKPTNCQCGNFRDAGHRWVVIERRNPPASSRLKCLECGWKWYVSRNYVSKLRDHVEYSRSGMTDEDILTLIESRLLFVNVETAEVFKFNSKNKAWKRLKIIDRESNGSRYQFVECCLGKLKKKVALHRLVWMFANQRTVPDGFDVDHVNGKRGDYPHRIDNLRLLESSRNRSLGCPSESMELFEKDAF